MCAHNWLYLPKKRNNQQFFWCMKCKLAGYQHNGEFIYSPRIFSKEELNTILDRFDP